MRTNQEGGVSLEEFNKQAALLATEAVDETIQQQATIGRNSLVRAPRPGRHDQMPNPDNMAARSIRSQLGDLSCGEDTPGVVPPEALAPPQEPANEVGVMVSPEASRLETSGGRPVSTAIIRLNNRAKSANEIIRSIEVVAAPRAQAGKFPRGHCFAEYVGLGLFDLFGLPGDSGRVYHITVTEHDSSAPQPRPNPFKPGTTL
jgi:hypothetical protein